MSKVVFAIFVYTRQSSAYVCTKFNKSSVLTEDIPVSQPCER